MTIPASLPTYNDDEVKVFHPLMEYALNEALRRMGLDSVFSVEHHYTVGAITADLAIVRRSSNRIVLIVEVKRQPRDVASTRYRLQAQSYVTQAGGQVESPYYAVTNLESTAAFRYDVSRPRVEQQLLDLGVLVAGSFASTPIAEFKENLVEVAQSLLTASINDSGAYHALSGNLVELLKERSEEPTKWHELLTVVGYEYIRGAMGRGTLPDAYRLRTRGTKLLEHGRTIDFAPLFTEPVAPSNDTEVWNATLLAEVFQDGRRSLTGSELPDIIHAIASDGLQSEGRVSTDLELARLTSVVAASVLGRQLEDGEVVADPAAGSGALLVEAREGFPSIRPDQLWANEVVEKDLEHLSMRLGLTFKGAITPQAAPKVTIQDVLSLAPEECESIAVALLNPPFVAGVRASDRKERFTRQFRARFRRNPKLGGGQSGLEAVFLEYVLALIPDGAVFAVILPAQYLNSRGPEAQQMRRFLLEDFGLQAIGLYPKAGLFEGVQKSTALFVGKKGVHGNSVKVLDVTIPLESVDLRRVKRSLTTLDTGYGYEVFEVGRGDLGQAVDSGWTISSVRRRVSDWLSTYLTPKTQALGDGFTVKRGEVGNLGASDLVFPQSTDSIWNEIKGLVPSAWLRPAIRNVDEFEDRGAVLTRAHLSSVALVAPESAFTMGTPDYDLLDEIVRKYEPLQRLSGSQRSQTKDADQLRRVLDRERKHATLQGSVLIPRNIRRYGRVYMLDDEAYLSTNVVKVSCSDGDEGRLLLSWLLTMFSQLHQESIGKDQEGARKLEVNGGVKDILVPPLSKLDASARQELIREVENASPVDLREPRASRIDRIWARVIWGDDAEVRLQEAQSLLEEVAFHRNPHAS